MMNMTAPRKLDIILSEFMSKYVTAETLTTAPGVGGFVLYKILIVKRLENYHPPTPLKIVGSADANNVTH